MSFQINYTPLGFGDKCLTKNEWLSMINRFISTLRTLETGSKLIEQLEYHCINGRKLVIANNDCTSRIIYPKAMVISGGYKIVIPNVPYFTLAPTISCGLDDICFTELSPTKQKIVKNIKLVSEHKPSRFSFKDNEPLLEFFTSFTTQPHIVMFAHEMIHALRHFQNIGDTPREEAYTIYGIDDNKGRIRLNNGSRIFITENTIRREIGLPPRVSHDSEYQYIYDLARTHDKKHLFNKESYLLYT